MTSPFTIKTHTIDVGVSFVGTWKRRGFTNLTGVITSVSIDHGKVLDTVLLSKKCKGCTKMQAITAIDPQAYEKWNAAYSCSLDYKD